MTTLEHKTKTPERLKIFNSSEGYYSVEFSLDKPRPLYQFKIWKSKSNQLFLVVKKESNVLSKLKTGSILNMTYYSTGKRKSMETQIGPITGKQAGRFHGHYTVDLFPMCSTGISNWR